MTLETTIKDYEEKVLKDVKQICSEWNHTYYSDHKESETYLHRLYDRIDDYFKEKYSVKARESMNPLYKEK